MIQYCNRNITPRWAFQQDEHPSRTVKIWVLDNNDNVSECPLQLQVLSQYRILRGQICNQRYQNSEDLMADSNSKQNGN